MDTPTTETPTPSQPEVKRKQHFKGKVTKLLLGTAIIDLGLSKPGFVHISNMSETPVNRVQDVLQVGQEVDVWVRRVDKKTGAVELTMIKPLDLEWREIKNGMIVTGKITRIESYGVFVDIGAERPGMIHISELDHDFVRNPYEVVRMDEEVTAQIIDFNRRKKQIKLSRKAVLEKPAPPEEEIFAPVIQQAEVKEKEEEEDNKPVPTAMEIALRKAMQGSQPKPAAKKAKPGKSNKLEDIFSRTLEGYQTDK